MSDEWTFFLALPAAGAVALVVRQLSRASDARLDASFASAASKLGLTFVPRGKQLVFPKASLVHGQVDHCNVRVDSYTVSKNKSAITYTRILARSAGGPGSFTLGVTEQKLGSSVSALLGVQDIDIGEKDFDDMFTVKSSAPDLVPRLLRGPLARSILDVARRGEAVEIRVEADAVEILSRGPVENPALVMALVHCATALARAPKIALDRWSDLARAVDGSLGQMDIWEKHGKLPPITLDVHGVHLTIHPSDDPARVRLQPAETRADAFDAAVVRGAGYTITGAGAGGAAIEVDATKEDIERAMDTIAEATHVPQAGAPYRE